MEYYRDLENGRTAEGDRNGKRKRAEQIKRDIIAPRIFMVLMEIRCSPNARAKELNLRCLAQKSDNWEPTTSMGKYVFIFIWIQLSLDCRLPAARISLIGRADKRRPHHLAHAHVAQLFWRPDSKHSAHSLYNEFWSQLDSITLTSGKRLYNTPWQLHSF